MAIANKRVYSVRTAHSPMIEHPLIATIEFEINELFCAHHIVSAEKAKSLMIEESRGILIFQLKRLTKVELSLCSGETVKTDLALMTFYEESEGFTEVGICLPDESIRYIFLSAIIAYSIKRPSDKETEKVLSRARMIDHLLE